MKITVKTVILLYFAAFLFLYSTSAEGAEKPKISANSAVLMDGETGQIIFEHRGFIRSEPASLTKIMTAIIALEYGHSDEIVTIGKKPANISVGQELQLTRGDRITLENLIKAALLYSANDSTVAIAQHISGDEEEFIGLMNAKAVALGALNTRFANTNGYHHPNHYSTAYDLALITRYALSNSKFTEIVSMKEATIYWADGEKQRTLGNTNRLVRNNSYEGIFGVKTGTTIRAGNCLVAAARRNGRTLIAVVLHSRNRYKDATTLFDYGFYNVPIVNLCDKRQIIGSIPVSGGVRNQVKAVSEKEVNVYLTDDDKLKVTTKIISCAPLQAPIKAGQKLGTAVFFLKERELARVNLVAAEKVNKPGLLYKFKSAL
ncbi:MAG: D-alanyl-D-alanine carboxypeptidase family protein [Bacillota bacterium]